MRDRAEEFYKKQNNKRNKFFRKEIPTWVVVVGGIVLCVLPVLVYIGLIIFAILTAE